MANRVTRVTLTAQVADYVAGMEKAAKSTRQTTTEAEKLARTHEKFQAVGRSAIAFGTLAAVGVGLAVSKFAEFDKQMSNVQAATHESVESMGALRDAALEAGADTVFSATEAAQAIEELGKAGVSTSDILAGGLKGSLDLAAAGELEVGAAAEIAATALTQFNLAGADVPHVADLLAAGAGKAQGTVQDLSGALNQSGLVASQMGLSIEETVGSLAAFASAGLMGSDAGTSFRSMLLRLANPTDESKQAMKDLGIAAYDASGGFVGIESIAGQLKDRLGGLTQAQRDQTLALVFGQDAIRAANILYTQGSEGIAEWTENVNDSGFAAETAELRMDNLAGDVEKLGGAFDTALIKTGSAANDALRGVTQGVTAAVDAFGKAPQAVQTTALAVGALAAAVGLVGGAFLLAVPKIAAFKVALATMSPGVQRAATVLGTVGKAAGFIATLGVAVSILDKLATGGTRAAVGVEKVLGALNKGDIETAFSNGTDSANSFAEALELVSGDSFDANMERIGEALGGPLGISGVVTEARQGFESLDAALSQMVAGGDADKAREIFRQVANAAEDQGIEIEKLEKLFPGYTDALAGANREAENGAGASDEFAEGLDAVGTSAEDAEAQVQDLADTIRGFGSEQLNLNDANRRVQESLTAFTETVEENGKTLNLTTEEGRANSEALDEIARAYLEAAAATVEQTDKQEDAIPIIQQGRDAIIAAGQAAGLSKEEAEKYADSLGLIPADVQTDIDANWDEAIRKAHEVAQAIRNITGYKAVIIDQVVKQTGAARGEVGAAYDNARGGMYAYADGGFAPGIYKGRAGSIHKFAEPETRWEAYVSGKPGMEDRNRQIVWEAGDRLGMWSGGAAAPAESGSSGALMSVVPRLFQKLDTIAERVGVSVPVGAVQGALGSGNVGSTVRGRA